MNPLIVFNQNQTKIASIALKHGVTKLSVFGSVARGEATEGSDLDLLIEANGVTSPWFPGGLIAELEELCGCRVDVVERRSLNALMLDSVLKEERPLIEYST